MLASTKGMVINFVKYGDTSIIVRVFTERYGRKTYIVNGVRSAKSRSKVALFQPLTLLDLVIYDRPSSAVNRLKEFRCIHPYATIPFDFKKSTVAMFLTELLDRSLQEQTHTEEVFYFLYSAFTYFDAIDTDPDFHLKFMMHWAKLQGFGTESAEEIMEQLSMADLPMAGLMHELHREMEPLQLLIQADLDASLQLTNRSRKVLLDVLYNFYRLHVEGLRHMKSLPVLQAMMQY